MSKKFKFLVTLSLVISLSLTAFVTVAAFASDKAQDSDAIRFSDAITAVTPGDGEEVRLVNAYIDALYGKFNGEYSSIAGLFNTTDEMATFSSVLSDKEKVHELYSKWDDFKPVNEVLKWECEGEAENYTVTVSLNSDLSTIVYKATVDEKELSLSNILYPDKTYYWQVRANLSEGESVLSKIFKFTTKDTIRTVDIDGVSNTRDIGGFDSLYGKTLNGLLYRGARLDDITEKGIAQMDALGIKSDVDLRNLNEGARNPSNRQNDYAYLSAPMYLQIYEEGYKGSIREVFTILADKDNYPVYFHCSVGRDRTGSLSFILNNLLGVDKREIVCDYLTSFFSVAGSFAVSKDSDDLLQAVYGMYIMLDAYDGDNYAEKTENFLLSVGVSKDEIDSVRDIFTGKIKVLPDNAENDDGYETYNIVTFACFGKADRTFAVKSGTTVAAPYELDEGFVWTVNGNAYDLSMPIIKDVRFVAKKIDGFVVTTIIDGQRTEKFYEKGAAVNFAEYDKPGYNRIVINDSGDILNSLVVDRDITLNVIYIKE